MDIAQFIRPLLCFLTFISLVGADHDYTTEDKHVIIGPAENITAYLTGSTTIVMTWDPPPVYLIHDVVGSTNFDEVAPENEVVVSKLPSSSAVNHTHITNSSTNSLNVTTTVASDAVQGGEKNDSENVGTIWKCRPISFFSNYTVEMREDLDISDHSMVIAFKDSTHKHELQTVTFKENQKKVPFSEGCVIGYNISWEVTDNSSTVFNMSVPPTSNLVNITGLKPATTYKVIIETVYISGHRFENKPAAYFTTKAVDEPTGCFCDMYGSISPSLGCNVSNSNLCNCKLGYEGTFCEMCAPGYYRTAPHFPCHRCPCDVHTARKSTCRFVEGFLRCDSCEVGYIGNICHTCDRGFYRFNRHCVPCYCNGNTPPKALHMCISTSGMCINCQHNTTGFNCERCLPGYVGDPYTFKNCTRHDEVLARSFNMGSSSVSPGVIAAVIITFLFVILMVVAVLLFRRYYSKEKRRAFWTIEMKRDSDDVDFSSVHNDDAHLGDADDVDFFAKHAISPSSNKYSRLQEDF